MAAEAHNVLCCYGRRTEKWGPYETFQCRFKSCSAHVFVIRVFCEVKTEWLVILVG